MHIKMHANVFPIFARFERFSDRVTIVKSAPYCPDPLETPDLACPCPVNKVWIWMIAVPMSLIDASPAIQAIS